VFKKFGREGMNNRQGKNGSADNIDQGWRHEVFQ
jgi:hypothetical protein